MDAVWLAWLALVVIIALSLWRRLKRREPETPTHLSDQAKTLLDARLPWLAALSEAQRAHFDAQLHVFLQQKRFIGCAGLQVTDEMKWLIAGMACLMLLRTDAPVFPQLRKLLIYPGPFLVPALEPDELGLVSDDPDERIGESWQGDRVILSWPDVEAALEGDEVNVVVHEFAHQLDDEGQAGEGAPALRDYANWSAVMQSEFERLRRHRRPPVLDPYGAESPAEFFGVVTEAFFQRGAELARHHAQLYALLRGYYGFDTLDIWGQP